MSAFTESALIKKLLELNASQQSIQTLSLWLIHHRKHYANIVKSWYKELLKGKINSLLVIFIHFESCKCQWKIPNDSIGLSIYSVLIEYLQ